VRVLIVDDEPVARRCLARLLRVFPEIEIVGECGDGPAAVEAILSLSPDLVFLDVQMPEMSGFDVLRALPRNEMPGGYMPAVIFVTAYDKYALDAFRVHAIDYLLKPIDDKLLYEAVTRARAQFGAKLEAASMQQILALLRQGAGRFPTHFTARTRARIQVIPAEKICWIGAAGDYVELHTGDGACLLRETISTMEAKLDPSRFLRIHRSLIVRSACIEELQVLPGRRYLLRLTDGSEHRSSRRSAATVEAWMNTGR
jgi:two-component system LytT family response regulator